MMKNFEITKDYTATKAKTDAKAEVISLLFSAMTDIFGEDNVAMVRTGGASKTNEIGVVVGQAEVDGTTAPVVVTVTASAKDFTERVTKSKTFAPFDFASAKEAYDYYIASKEEKDAEKAAAKAAKIKADEEKRAGSTEIEF